MKPINRTVWILSLVSLFADVASEMLYPVIPVYLREAGFSFLLIGLLEGFANFTSGISKGFFGKRSDETGKRLPFVRTGYFFSAVSKPLFAFSSFVPWIFFARLLDRLGKGVRTAARDALLSDNATPQTKGTVFGFHRAMDTAGAALGPLLALLLLRLWPGQYKTIFLLAFLPGIFSVALIFLLREVRKSGKIKTGGHFLSYLGYWKEAGPAYRKVAPGLLFLALFNSADVFLLLKAREVLGSDAGTIGAYLLYNTVFALAS